MTPGPWTVEIMEGNEPAVVGADGRYVAVCCDHGDGGTMALSNARVIAAVPLMLAALVRVGCQDGDGCPDEHDGRCFVCAAIAKAVTP